MCVFMCARMSVCAYVNVLPPALVYVCVCVCMCARVSVCVCAHMYVFVSE